MNICRALDEISETIFPSNIYCIVCGSLIDRSRPYALCDECMRKMHWITGRTCTVCGKALQDTYRGAHGSNGGNLCYDCMEREHFFKRGWSCMTYGLHEREVMMDIKYNRKGYIARKMGDVMFDRMESLIAEAAKKEIVPFDVVVPVPVSKKRLIKRGYNQSELMARQFVKRWRDFSAEVPRLEGKVLERRRETVMLRSLNPAERRLALKGAFGIISNTEVRITGKTVLLIDDIYTTGATADECSKVLLEGGAEEVYILTLCSGGNRPPDSTEQKPDSN